MLENNCENLNLEDIKKIDFDPNLTRFIINTSLPPSLDKGVREILKYTKLKQIKKYFGFGDEISLGNFYYPAVQVAPTFPTFLQSFGNLINDDHRCLVVAGIDQSPYFSLASDLHKKMSHTLPDLSMLYNKFLPALSGIEKASSSKPSNAIFLDDSFEIIRAKMRKAFSDRAYLPNDVAMAYLEAFLEDEIEFQRIKAKYSSGDIGSLELKEYTSQVLSEIATKFQNNNT